MGILRKLHMRFRQESISEDDIAKPLRKKRKNAKLIITSILLNVIALGMITFLQHESMQLQSMVVWGAVLFWNLTVLIYFIFKDFWNELDKNFTKHTVIWLLFGFAYLLWVCFLFIWWFGQENTIQQYDAVVYWEKALTYSQSLPVDFWGNMQKIHNSLSQEYTDIASIPIAVLMRFLGQDFSVYCFCVFWVYYVPASLSLAIFAGRLWADCKKERVKISVIVLCFVLFLSSPAFLYPVFRGYLDVVGVLIISWMLNILLHWDWKKFTPRKNILWILISVLLLLSRRWYAFYIVGFYFCIGVNFLIDCVKARRWDAPSFFALFKNLIMIALGSSVLIFAVCPQLLANWLGKNLGDAYSIYKEMPFYEDLWETAKSQGLWVLVLMIVGVISLVKMNQRHQAVEVGGATLVAAVLFFRIQTMGIHHRYLITPAVLIFACIGILSIQSALSSPKRGKWNVLVPTVVVLVSAVSLVNSFVPAANRWLRPVSWAMSNVSYAPPYLETADVIRQIAVELNDLTENQCKTVYVCGEGENFSQELLRKSRMPETTSAVPSLISNSIVDLRDEFPSGAFLADYIVIQTPFVTSFYEEQVVSKSIWEMVQSDSHYQMIKNYPLNDGEIQIYEKIEPVTWEMIDEVQKKLDERYPDHKGAFSPNWFVALENVRNAKSLQYEYGSNTVEKQAGQPLEMFWNLDGHFDSVSFTLINWTPGIQLKIWADGTLMDEYELACTGEQNILIATEQTQSLKFRFSGADDQNVTLTFVSTQFCESETA